MKRLLLPILILLGIVAFSLWNSTTLERSAQRWCSQLEGASALAAGEKWDGAAAALEGSYRDWERHQMYLHIVASHDAVDSAEAMYRRAMAFGATRELSEFLAETADLSAHLTMLAQSEGLRLSNIL